MKFLIQEAERLFGVKKDGTRLPIEVEAAFNGMLMVDQKGVIVLVNEEI